MILLIFYGIAAGGAIWLLDKSICLLDLRTITITKTFYFFFFLMTWLPGPFIYFENGRSERSFFLSGIIFGLLSAAFGTIISTKVQDFETNEITNFFKKKFTKLTNQQIKFVNKLHLLILLPIAAALILYYLKTPIIPFFNLFQNLSPEELQQAREEAFKLLDPRWTSQNSTKWFYLFLILRTTIFPFFILTTCALYFMKRNQTTLLIFSIFLSLGLLYAATTLARAPVAAIILRIIVLWIIFNNGKLSPLKLFISFLSVIIFPLFITSFYKTRNLIELFVALGERMTITPARDLYFFFEIFPKHKEFLNGHTLVRPFYDLFGIKTFYLENFVSMYISPSNIKTAHTNAVYISNLYADFGFLGLIFGSFLVGFFIQFIDTIILRSKKCFLNCTLFSFFVYLAIVLNFGSITSVLLANGGLVVVGLWFLFKQSLKWLRP